MRRSASTTPAHPRRNPDAKVDIPEGVQDGSEKRLTQRRLPRQCHRRATGEAQEGRSCVPCCNADSLQMWSMLLDIKGGKEVAGVKADKSADDQAGAGEGGGEEEFKNKAKCGQICAERG